jgi:hypothetical protein
LHQFDGEYDWRRFCIGGKMDNLIGKITASLIEKDQSLHDGLIDKINENIRPPEEITPDDIYIRAMYLVSDQVNSYGGRFPIDEHDCIIKHLIDCPVLIGHRKDSLPIARTFYAEKEQRDGHNWVKVYFYWLKNSVRGEDLRNNIDGGIYKECSISFIFRFPECSICGSDIRNCRHRPFKKYDSEAGKQQETFFNYRQIDKVLEVSLVYRGSVHDTAITGNLFVPLKDAECESSIGTKYEKPINYRIWDLNRLDEIKDYHVMPAYESLNIIIEKTNRNVIILDPNRVPIENKLLSDYTGSLIWPDGEYTLDCRLIGYRGKSRQPVSELLNLLKEKKSSARRFELKIYDLLYHENLSASINNASKRRSKLEKIFNDKPELLIPVEKVKGAGIIEIMNRCGTRYGIEIFDCNSPVRYSYTRRRIVPLQVSELKTEGEKTRYQLHGFSGGEHIPVALAISSEYKLNEGDLIEVETYSMHRSGSTLKLAHPKIHDTYGALANANDIDITHLLEEKPKELSSPVYDVHESDGESIILRINDDDSENFLLRGYSAELVHDGRRLLVESHKNDEGQAMTILGSGNVVKKQKQEGRVLYHFQGFFDGEFVLRPIILNGQQRRIFYRLDSGVSAEGCYES